MRSCGVLFPLFTGKTRDRAQAKCGRLTAPGRRGIVVTLQCEISRARRGPACKGEGMGMPGTNSLIVILVVGLIAGWLAGKITRGAGFGIIGDIIIGVIGAFVGSWLWSSLLKLPVIFHNFWVDSIVIATIGAVVLLLILRLIRRVV